MRDLVSVVSEPGRHSCVVIAEVAQAHDGSLGMAHAYIDAVAEAGADAVKFQTHIAAAESTPHEPWRVRFSRQDETRYDYWKRMEFTEEQWRELKTHADERDVIFLSSPFSVEAVDLLERVGMPLWKIASGEVDDQPMLDRVFLTQKPVVFSSGMSDLDEVESMVMLARSHDVPVGVLQSTTEYPCPPERLGLDQISAMRERFRCAVGLSDHSGSIYAGIAAAALGIDFLEVHVTFSRDTFGPDVAASITTAELRALVDGVRFAEQATQTPSDKAVMSRELQDVRRIFSKSVVAARPLSAGQILTEEDLAVRKAGGGLPPRALGELIGKKVVRELAANEVVAEEDTVTG